MITKNDIAHCTKLFSLTPVLVYVCFFSDCLRVCVCIRFYHITNIVFNVIKPLQISLFYTNLI